MEIVNKLLAAVVLLFIMACIHAIPLYFAWNYFVDRFSLPRLYELSLFDAVALSVLASCLFSHSSTSKNKD